MAVRNAENGVVRGHSKSTAMSPFDRAHRTSYSTLIETRHLVAPDTCYRFRDIAGYLSKVADFDPPHLHSAPSLGVTPVEFRGDIWHQKTRVLVWCCLCDPTFSRFSRTPTCDRQTDTDRQRHRQTQTQAHG